jgi:hypothetical protein
VRKSGSDAVGGGSDEVAGERNCPIRQPKVIRVIERFCAGVLLLLAAAAIGLAGTYTSFNPSIGRFSAAYCFGVIVPLGLCGVTAVALLWPGIWRPLNGRRMPRFLVIGMSILVLGAAIVFSSMVPESRAAIAALFLVPALWFAVLARLNQTGQLFLTATICGLVGLTLVAFELTSAFGPAQVRWGDEEIVAYMFPRQPPFVGTGGRLRPGLDCVLEAPGRPGGVSLITNADGFRNRREFSAEPSHGVVRVLSLGDSFSNGYGMGEDEFFGALLEDGLNGAGGGRETDALAFEVLNAEVSDPAHGLYYLQRYGVSFHPRIVMYGLCGNDVAQVSDFVGPGRRLALNSDGILYPSEDYGGRDVSVLWESESFVYPIKSKKLMSSRWSSRLMVSALLKHVDALRLTVYLKSVANRGLETPAPMYSFLQAVEAMDGHKRLLDGYSNLAFFYPAGSHVTDPMWDRFFMLLREFDKTARGVGAVFVLVVYPQRFQVQERDWQEMCEYAGLENSDFDLDLPEKRILDFCRRNDILCLDLLETMRTAGVTQDLYLPGGDMHFNRAGTRIAAERARDYILESALQQFPPTNQTD